MAETEAHPVLKPLIGSDEATFDGKNRLLFSRQKRERLGDTFAVALCETGSLACYPLQVWERMWAELSAYSPLDMAPRRYEELLFNHADDEVKFDPQNRAVISKALREIGKLKDRVLIIGRGHRAELWDPDERAAYLADQEKYEQRRREEFERASMQVLEKWSRR